MAFQRRNQDQQDKTNKGASSNQPTAKHHEGYFKYKGQWVPRQKTWLAADPIYKQAQSNIGLSWTNFKNQQKVAFNRARSDYQNTLQDMATQKREDIRDMTADFAARGLGNSGEFFREKEDVYLPAYQRQKQYAKQTFERAAGGKWVGKGKNRHLVFDVNSDLGMQATNQGQVRTQQLDNAYWEALLRRMQKYGLSGYGA